MRVVYMGTPDFAVPSLKTIIGDPAFQIVGVVTQPDRPKGRGNQLAAPPVKKVALEFGLEVFQPDSINTAESYAKLVEWCPDVIVVVAFGQILKSNVLELPPSGCINVHASLLPKYRGAAPIHWAIIRGETKTGITTMFMEQGLDTGDIILSKELDIGPSETTGELHDRLADAGADVLLCTLHLLKQGEVPRRKQDESKASYAPVLKREHEEIDWRQSACRISNLIRGLNPWPGSYTTINDKIIKVWKAHVLETGEVSEAAFVPGEVVNVAEMGIIVQTGNGQIVITELQMQNRSRMSVDEFLRGNPVQTGIVMGGAAPNGGNQG